MRGSEVGCFETRKKSNIHYLGGALCVDRCALLVGCSARARTYILFDLRAIGPWLTSQQKIKNYLRIQDSQLTLKDAPLIHHICIQNVPIVCLPCWFNGGTCENNVVPMNNIRDSKWVYLVVYACQPFWRKQRKYTICLLLQCRLLRQVGSDYRL